MLGTLLLAGACLPLRAQPPALADTDLLYCARAYAEAATLLKADPSPGVRRTGRDAQLRARALDALDADLLTREPARHEQARTLARQRLSAMPVAPPDARRLALRAAYLECRYLQAGTGGIPVPVPASVPTLTQGPLPLSVPLLTLTPAPPAGAALSPPSVSAHPLPAAATPATTTPAAASRLVADAAPSTAASGGLGDADMLYCTQVYSEIASAFGDGDGEAAEAARDARERWRTLSERDHDLLNDDPGRHSRASAAALPRLAALPEKPGRARSMALRSAYGECRGLEDRAAARPAPDGDRVQMLANRHFCRDMLMRRLKVSPKVRAGFTPNELAALDEIQRIGEALALPMPGAALTLEQDREANRLTRQLLHALEQAAATWRGEGDPVARAMGQCHDDYTRGLLGGPDVLSPLPEDALPAAAPAAPVAPHTPVVQPADLGPVFHMREVTPVGNFEGIWVRRGRSPVYDAVWVQVDTGQMQRDVLELRGIVDGELTLYRQSYRGSYRARVAANGALEPGSASWFDNAAYSWSALPPQSVRNGDLGAVVRMREVTPRGNYEGIWRQRGQTGVYDVLWVFLPSGEITADVLSVRGVARGRLIIQREKDAGIYPVKRRADTLSPGTAATGGKALSQWIVLPAQSVRLKGVSRPPVELLKH